MKTIDGFYFSIRYPGEDSIMLDSENIGIYEFKIALLFSRSAIF